MTEFAPSSTSLITPARNPPTSKIHHSRQSISMLGMASWMNDPHSWRQSSDQPDGQNLSFICLKNKLINGLSGPWKVFLNYSIFTFCQITNTILNMTKEDIFLGHVVYFTIVK